ncbi:MAG: RnfABCDGE type electron transport complex subunit D [Clostridiales bacterium]|nr:RnfABCDGE type electron transport complex subunit D [Clostridiales bacterium]
MNKLTVSASPHVRSSDTVTGIMLDVIIALVPSLIASIVLFGFRSLLITAVCVGCCVLFEFLSRKIMKRDCTLRDLSAVVTGMLLAFNMPVSIPLWMCVVGCFFAIVVVKQFFGGIGQNFVNPAIGGRIVMLVSFSSAMTSWTEPLAWLSGVDASTTATPLSELKNYSGEISDTLPSLWEMFLGIRGGCIGEVCAAAILIGGIYLIARRVIKPTIPLCFIGTVAVIMLIAGKGDFEFMAYELLSGGLLLGAIFMATDYATSPITTKGKIIFGIGCGIITSVIRLFANLPEGVSYSIILMNILVPHIEALTKPKPFGTEKEKKTKEEKAS